MQILKSSKEKTPEFNQFVPHDPNYSTVNLDSKAAMAKACREKASKFEEWKDADNSSFSSYGELLDYQSKKFCSRYPPNFVRGIRNELALVFEGKISWNIEAVKILMTDSYAWNLIVKQIENAILKWDGFDFEKYQFDINLNQMKADAVQSALDKFILKLQELQSGNN